MVFRIHEEFPTTEDFALDAAAETAEAEVASAVAEEKVQQSEGTEKQPRGIGGIYVDRKWDSWV